MSIKNQKGFTQILILIAIIVGIAALGSAGYFAYKIGKTSQNISPTTPHTDLQATTTANATATTNTDVEKKDTDNKVNQPKTEVPVAGDPFQTENSTLKIEKCKAERDKNLASYETIIPDMVDLLAQNYINALMQQFKPQADAGLITASDLADMAQMPAYRAEKTKELRANFTTDVNNKYYECINKI